MRLKIKELFIKMLKADFVEQTKTHTKYWNIVGFTSVRKFATTFDLTTLFVVKGCVIIDKLQGQKNGSYIVTENILKEELNLDNIEPVIKTLIKFL